MNIITESSEAYNDNTSYSSIVSISLVLLFYLMVSFTICIMCTHELDQNQIRWLAYSMLTNRNCMTIDTINVYTVTPLPHVVWLSLIHI